MIDIKLADKGKVDFEGIANAMFNMYITELNDCDISVYIGLYETVLKCYNVDVSSLHCFMDESDDLKVGLPRLSKEGSNDFVYENDVELRENMTCLTFEDYVNSNMDEGRFKNIVKNYLIYNGYTRA